MMTAVIVVLLFMFVGLASAQQTKICPTRSFIQRPNSDYCYQYVASLDDWHSANQTCQSRGDNSSLLWIDSNAENTYVRDTFFTSNANLDFWLGLTDLTDEGVFKWSVRRNGKPLDEAYDYSNWAPKAFSDNTPNKDCVKFSSDGWRVDTLFCTHRLSYVCKQPVCSSNDGVECVATAAPLVSTGPAGSTVAGVVIGVILFIIVLIIIVALVLLWKFQNDRFYRYMCCCIYGKTQPAIHSLQQENQRLRQELQQQKLSLSGRFPSHGLLGDDEAKESKVAAGNNLPLPPLKTISPRQSVAPGVASPLPPLSGLGSPLPPLNQVPLRPNRITPMMSPLPPTTPFPPSLLSFGRLSALPPLIPGQGPQKKLSTPLPPKVAALPSLNRPFQPLKSPLSPISELSPMSPPPPDGSGGSNERTLGSSLARPPSMSPSTLGAGNDPALPAINAQPLTMSDPSGATVHPSAGGLDGGEEQSHHDEKTEEH